ncbi:methyltransferase domain-containing protein [Pasteurella sp. P03HT]
MVWETVYSQTMTLPHSWRQLQNGDAYCRVLSQSFSTWFPKISGYPLLKIGGLSAEITSHVFLPEQLILTPLITEPIQKLAQLHHANLLQADTTAFPFIEKSIHACLLANTLNFSQDPHQVLREVNRVLTEDGYLFLSLFNSISPLLFKRYLNKKHHEKLRVRYYSTWRILDWLALLNFDILACQALAHQQHSTCFPHLIMIVARKRVYPLTLNLQKTSLSKPTQFEPIGVFNSFPLHK